MSVTDDQYQSALADLMSLVEEPAETGEAPVQSWDPASTSQPEPEQEEPGPDLHYGTVDEFVREVILPLYQRTVGPRGSRRWAAQWWRNGEAVSRLDSLWRSWEHLRQDGATGISTWWRDHADYHMERLMDPDGPFSRSEDSNRPGQPLPYEPPPQGLFIDAREGRA